MIIVRVIGVILLAVYLIFMGLLSVAGISTHPLASAAVGLIGIGAGALLLISIGTEKERH